MGLLGKVDDGFYALVLYAVFLDGPSRTELVLWAIRAGQIIGKLLQDLNTLISYDKNSVIKVDVRMASLIVGIIRVLRFERYVLDFKIVDLCIAQF